MGAKVSLSGEVSRQADDAFSGKTIHKGQLNISPTVTEASLNSPLYVLIHSNSVDKYGRSVCKRVSKINSFLLQKGMRTSFGNYEEKNLGRIPNTINNRPNDRNSTVTNSMASYNSALDEQPNVVFILFLTEQYLGTLLTQVGKYYDDVKLNEDGNLQFRYLDTTIRNLIQRYHNGTCRIVPIIMEEDSLEASRFYDYNRKPQSSATGAAQFVGGFDSMRAQLNPLDASDIAVKFVWTIDYSADNSFGLVTRQLMQVLSSWKAQDLQSLSKRTIGNVYSGDCNIDKSPKLVEEAVEYNVPNELASYPPGVSPYARKHNVSDTQDPQETTAATGTLTSNQLVESIAHIFTYDSPERHVGAYATINDAIEAGLVLESVEELQKAALYDWLYRYFNKNTLQFNANIRYCSSGSNGILGNSISKGPSSVSASPIGKGNISEPKEIPILTDKYNYFNSVDDIFILLQNDGVNSVEDLVDMFASLSNQALDLMKSVSSLDNASSNEIVEVGTTCSNYVHQSVCSPSRSGFLNREPVVVDTVRKMYEKYFRKAMLDDTVNANSSSKLVGDSKPHCSADSGIDWFYEVFMMHAPSIYVVATMPAPVRRGIRGLVLPDLLQEGTESNHKSVYTRVTPADSVLYAVCPVLIDSASSLQEIALLFQLCVQAVSSQNSGAGPSGGTSVSSLGGSSIPLVQTIAVSSNVVLSAVPTLSFKHPLNQKLSKIQDTVVKAIYGDPPLPSKPNTGALRGIPSDIDESVCSSEMTAIPALGGFGGAYGEINLYVVANFAVQAMMELSSRFVKYIENRCVASENGGHAGLDNINNNAADTEEYLAGVIKNPIEEFCSKLNGCMLLCDILTAFVSLSKQQIAEMEYREKAKARRVYKLHKFSNDPNSLKDDNFLEGQRKVLYNVFTVNALACLNCVFSGLSIPLRVNSRPNDHKDRVLESNKDHRLIGGDWYYDEYEEGNIVYETKQGSVFNDPMIRNNVQVNKSISIPPLNNLIFAAVDDDPGVSVDVDTPSDGDAMHNGKDLNPDVSSLIKLIYSHNVNNIFACCNYTICDSLISLVKPSVISGENGEMISILYCTVLQHLSATDIACSKLGIAKISVLLQYMMSTYGERCCINTLISWPEWLVTLFQYCTLYNTIWVITANLSMNEKISRIRISASRVYCEHMVISLAHGFQQLFEYYDEILEVNFNINDTAAALVQEKKPLKASGSLLYYETPITSSTEPIWKKKQDMDLYTEHKMCHLSKEEVEMIIYNILLTIYYISIISDDPLKPIDPASAGVFEELISFDVMRIIVHAFHNNLSTVLAFIRGTANGKSVINRSLDHIRQILPFKIRLKRMQEKESKSNKASLSKESELNVHSLYVLIGVCKALHGLCAHSRLLKGYCIDNSCIKVFSNAFGLVYKEEQLLIELLPPLITLLQINDDFTLLIGDSEASKMGRRRLYVQFCRGLGHKHISDCLDFYFRDLVSRQPLLPGVVDTNHTIIRDVLIVFFWFLYHGNDGRFVEKVGKSLEVYEEENNAARQIEETDGIPCGTCNTPIILKLFRSLGICRRFTCIFTNYTNRLVDLMSQLTVMTSDEYSMAGRKDDVADSSLDGRFDRSALMKLNMFRNRKTVPDDISYQSSVVPSPAEAASAALVNTLITEEELCLMNTIDYILKIMCYIVTEENSRLLFGTSDAFCQSLLNIFTLVCKLMLVYENATRYGIGDEGNDDDIIEGTVGVGSPRGISCGERKRRHVVLKTALVYIITECSFILRAICVDSCSQTNLLRQPVKDKPTYSTREDDEYELGIVAEPYSTWFGCILSVMDLYMCIFTIPVNNSDKFDDGIAYGEADDDENSCRDDLSSLKSEISSFSHQTKYTTNIPHAHNTFQTTTANENVFNTAASWASSISDASMEHVLYAALSLTCGASVSSEIMRCMFYQFSEEKPTKSTFASFIVPTSGKITSKAYNNCLVLSHLFKRFIQFIKVFSTSKNTLTLMIWEILRRQFTVWLFPYHNTTLPSSSTATGLSDTNWDDNGSRYSNSTLHSDALQIALKNGSFDVNGSENQRLQKYGNLSVDEIQSSGESGVVAVQNQQLVPVVGDEDSVLTESVASSADYHLHGYREKYHLENVTVGYDGVNNLHNNKTGSSLKYMASLKPSLSISRFVPFKAKQKSLGSESEAGSWDNNSFDSSSFKSAGTYSTNSTSLIGKFSAWFNYSSTGYGVGIGVKGTNKGTINQDDLDPNFDYHYEQDRNRRLELEQKRLRSMGKYSPSNSSEDSVVGHNMGTNAIGAISVSNKNNPVHSILTEFRKIPKKKSRLRSVSYNIDKSTKTHLDICMYDTLYYVLSISCGLREYAQVSVYALQVLIIILQGYVHDKKAYRELCKMLYNKRMFDLVMKYLLVILDPVGFNPALDTVAGRLTTHVESPEAYYSSNNKCTIPYNGKQYGILRPPKDISLKDMGIPGVERGPTSSASLSSALPVINTQDVLSRFVDTIDCDFPTVRSTVTEPPEEEFKRNARRYSNGAEVDIIKYVCSLVSFAAVDEDTRYILKSVLYVEEILKRVLALPRYSFAASDARRNQTKLNPAETCNLEEMPLSPDVIDQVHKIADVAFDNVAWRDTRLKDHAGLHAMLDKMNKNFDNLNITNTTKLNLLNSKYLEKEL